jgi:uncharacterized protein YjbI with pentapeptide repeats
MPSTPAISKAGEALVARKTAARVDLSTLDRKLQSKIDLIDYTLTGDARAVHDLGHHNFISCVFDGVIADSIDLARCDFKDTLVVDSVFSKCKISASSHASTVYVRSTFEECDFTEGAQTDCEYRDVTFVRCRLSNLLIKDSRLYDCVFEDCSTETHVFENDVFLRSRFVRSELELRTITSNFGLKLAQLEECRVRDARASEEHRFVEPDDIGKLALSASPSPLVLLSVRYFLDGDLLRGGDDIDRAFDIRRWIELSRQPASFAKLLEQLTEFLMNAYEANELDMHKMLVLHDVTRQIIASAGSEESLGFRFSLAFGGIHLALSRLVEEYLTVLYEVSQNSPQHVHLVVQGPLDKSYYEDHLGGFLNHAGVGVYAVRPHNSPVELELVELFPGGRFFALALILASFVRVELHARRQAVTHPRIASHAGGAMATAVATTEGQEFFELTSGLSSDERRAYELRIKALVPGTSIIVDLKLDVSTALISKLRDVVVKVLQSPPHS